MARPQKQTVDYFPHFADASAGDTLTVLEGQFGNDGYVFWFKLLEKLASSEGHYLDCSNSRKWQVLLGRAKVEEDTGRKIMVLLVEMQAIDKELWENHSIIWCQNLVDNVAEAYKNRKREIPQKPNLSNLALPKLTSASKSKISTAKKVVSTTENSITTADNPHTKLNNTKVNNKENIKRKYGEFKNVLLTDKEYQKLKDKLGSEADRWIEEVSRGKAAKGYKYKSDYAAILNWQRRDKDSGKAKGRELPKAYTPTADYPDL